MKEIVMQQPISNWASQYYNIDVDWMVLNINKNNNNKGYGILSLFSSCFYYIVYVASHNEIGTDWIYINMEITWRKFWVSIEKGNDCNM